MTPAAPFDHTTSPAARRRSSAAHTRPAAPPPSVPIPNIPPDAAQRIPPEPIPEDLFPTAQSNGLSLGPRTSSFARQTPSPNLTAVAAFSQSRLASSSQLDRDDRLGLSLSQQDVTVDDLSDPPPPSILPTSSRMSASQQPQEPDPPQDRSSDSREHRAPSSRRALTRALELAREAVQLDSTNNNPEAAVMAYGRSVALLSEVMDRVRRGEDTTEPGGRRRNGRRRSVVAQEEEIRRLQSIHDTYADRMNILSIIYSIPPVPYATASSYSTAASDTTSSTIKSSSMSSEAADLPPPRVPDYVEHGRDQDAMHAIGSAMFSGSLHSPVNPDPPSGLPPVSGIHPYAIPLYEPPPPPPPQGPPAINRTSIQPPRRTSRASALPPAPPPPSVSPPLPPSEPPLEAGHQQRQHLEVVNRQRGDSVVGHRRTGSGSRLAVLEEEEPTRPEERPAAKLQPQHLVDMPRSRQSPPLPPIPSPSSSDTPGTPRSVPSRVTSSPRPANAAIARPRGSSQLSARSETSQMQMINSSTNQGTIFQRRTRTSNPSTPRSSSPSESVASAGSNPVQRQTTSSLPAGSGSPIMTRARSSSQPGRRPSVVGGRLSPSEPPPVPPVNGVNGILGQRKPSYPSKLNPGAGTPLTVNTDFLSSPPMHSSSVLGPPFTIGMPTTPTSPLPPMPPADPLRKPYHLMNQLRTTMVSPTGGYITRRLHVPQEVWSQGGAKLTNLVDKIRVVGILFSALEDLQLSSSEYFGAGNVSSGMALGIGSITRREGEAWIARLEDFSVICDTVMANFGKKLGVGEGFVIRKTTWGDKLGRRFDKFTNGKNLDSPAAYVQGLKKLFLHAQLLDEHTKAVTSQPVAPAYASFPLDIRSAAEIRLKRSSEFFASVVLTFVVRDLSALLDKYAKKCEKWLEE